MPSLLPIRTTRHASGMGPSLRWGDGGGVQGSEKALRIRLLAS